MNRKSSFLFAYFIINLLISVYIMLEIPSFVIVLINVSSLFLVLIMNNVKNHYSKNKKISVSWAFFYVAPTIVVFSVSSALVVDGYVDKIGHLFAAFGIAVLLCILFIHHGFRIIDEYGGNGIKAVFFSRTILIFMMVLSAQRYSEIELYFSLIYEDVLVPMGLIGVYGFLMICWVIDLRYLSATPSSEQETES